MESSASVSCEICVTEYNETDSIPKTLDCGHTFCSSCITQLENSICPKCREVIPSGREFPVNLAILSLVEERISQRSLIDVMVPAIQNLKAKLDSKMVEICNNKEDIESDLRFLTSLENEILNEEYENNTEMQEKFRKLEEKYKESSLHKFFHFSLESTSDNDFLQEIYKVLKHSDKVFTFEYIDQKKVKFGELTVRDNKIMIHSLSLNDIPKSSKIVQFKNLRESLRAKPLHTFFEITTKNNTSHTIIIQPHDTNLVPHFIKHCTAENSSTYKNLKFTKGKNIKVSEDINTTDKCGKRTFKGKRQLIALESLLEVVVSEGLLLDYNKNNPSMVPCIENDVIVKETENDGFQFLRVIKPNEYSMLGKVLYPSDLWNHVTYENEGKILDCGLVVEL